MNRDLDIPAMLAGYLECALWSSNDEAGYSLDGAYFATDFTPESQTGAREDCIEFMRQCTEAEIDLSLTKMESSSIGHDLWLTRNGHGAGFWDRGLGSAGERLTEIAKAMGSRDVVETEGDQLVIE